MARTCSATLTGQPFVKDPDVTVEKLLAAPDATGLLHEGRQQPELGRAEADQAVATPAGCGVGLGQLHRGLGTGLLAGLAVVMAGPILVVEAGMGENILILTFVVIDIGEDPE